MFKILIVIAIVYFAFKFFKRSRSFKGYKKGYRKFSSSDFPRHSQARHYGQSHYKKRHSSHSFFSS